MCEGRERSPLTYPDRMIEGTPAQNLKKGQDQCYQSYFKKLVFFHFFTVLIWNLRVSTSKVGVNIAVVHYIKPTTHVNHGVALMAFLKITSSVLVCAAGGKAADVGVYRYRLVLWGGGFTGVASF